MEDPTIESILSDILFELTTMNTLRAMSMSHDSLGLSSAEQDFVDLIANTPFDGEGEDE
jgi:hypothetical protein